MTKIAEAHAALAVVEAEVESLKQQSRQYQLEVIRLDGSSDPDDIARRAALLEARKELDRQIPANAYPRGAERPVLAWRLEKAREHLADVRRQRATLAGEIADLEEEEAATGQDLDELERCYEFLMQTYNKVGWPTGLDFNIVRSLLFGVRAKRQRFAALLVWRERLAEYGDDPAGDYHEPEPQPFDRAVIKQRGGAWRQSAVDRVDNELASIQAAKG